MCKFRQYFGGQISLKNQALGFFVFFILASSSLSAVATAHQEPLVDEFSNDYLVDTEIGPPQEQSYHVGVVESLGLAEKDSPQEKKFNDEKPAETIIYYAESTNRHRRFLK